MEISAKRVLWAAAVSAAMALALTGVGCKKNAAASAEEGRTLFESTCARCHGMDGSGGAKSAGGGIAPRNFRDHTFQAGRTDDELRNVIANGKGLAMPPFGTMYSDIQMRALVAHVRSFDPGASK